MVDLTPIEKFALQMIALYYNMNDMSPTVLANEFRKIVEEYTGEL